MSARAGDPKLAFPPKASEAIDIADPKALLLLFAIPALAGVPLMSALAFPPPPPTRRFQAGTGGVAPSPIPESLSALERGKVFLLIRP